jgi:hypothetical protein
MLNSFIGSNDSSSVPNRKTHENMSSILSLSKRLTLQLKTKLTLKLKQPQFAILSTCACIFAVTTIVSHPSQAAVWKDTNKWDDAWETRYSEWIENTVTTDFFVKGKWAGIPTDCADAVYYLRAIFSYENSLPFFLQNKEKNMLITNKNTVADKIADPVEKIKFFMVKIIRDYGHAKSLGDDTYPIAINRQNMTPGVVWLREPTHAEMLHHLDETGVLHMIGSSQPEGLRILNTKTDLVSHPFDPAIHGMRRWKHPDQINTPVENLPGYSLEQYNFVRTHGEQDELLDTSKSLATEWKNIVQNKLALSKEDIQSARNRLAADICQQIQARNEAITQGEAYKLQNPGCMNAKAFDDYSTPGRDSVIQTWMYNLAKMKSSKMSSMNTKAEMIAEDLTMCENIQLNENLSIKTSDFAKNILNGKTSTNPNDSLLARWGLAPKYSTEESRKCPESFEQKPEDDGLPGEQ